MTLAVEGLDVRFLTRDGVVQALSDVSFRVEPGEIFVVVGESGSGKSVLAHSLLRLLPANARWQGNVTLQGTVLTDLPDNGMARLRGRTIALIPQSPAAALNPVLTMETQLREIARARKLFWKAAQDDLEGILARLGLDWAAVRDKYPHQLSGGMQQRIVNAAAMLGRPPLVVADEPTYGMDPDLVDQMASLLLEVPKGGSALLVITHDLRFARRLGGRIAVLYGSYLVESRASPQFFAGPLHPYGQGLLEALPENGLREIPGSPPSLTALPKGCPFAPRCRRASFSCFHHVPEPVPLEEGGRDVVRCLLYT